MQLKKVFIVAISDPFCALHKGEMPVLPNAALSIYTSWIDTFHPATFCAFDKVGDVRSSIRRIVGIYCLAYTQLLGSITPTEVRGRILSWVVRYVR